MILRDGSSSSVWQGSAFRFSPSSAPVDDVYDVAIVGGGITGLTTALLLQESGQRCLLLESHALGFGTTGGTTAHLNTFIDNTYDHIISDFGLEKARLVAGATREAIALVRSNIQVHNIACGFQEEPGYVFSQTDDQRKSLDKIFDACREVGLEVENTDSIPYPMFFNKAMRIAGQAKLHPLRYSFGLAAAFEKAGGIIMEQCRVLHHNTRDEIVRIETSNGSYSAKALVYATHIPPGINLLHLRCAPYRSYAMAVKLDDEVYPEGLAYDMYDPYHYYRMEDIDGEKFLIVGGEDHKTGESENTNGCFLHLESHIRSNFSVREITHQWSSQYFEPVDGLPYIGHLPGNAKNIYVATGFGGNGITYSQVAAIVLKGMIMRQPTPYDDLFSPGRIKPVAGFADFVSHNADVVKQFVGRWFGHQDLEGVVSLAPGEAKVLKHDNELIAIYKDEQGNIHAVSPVCTHMKCTVSWNAAERSWDCPCHGARYGVDGTVLTGPASRDLEIVEVRTLVEKE